jgi:hypothetical protein
MQGLTIMSMRNFPMIYIFSIVGAVSAMDGGGGEYIEIEHPGEVCPQSSEETTSFPINVLRFAILHARGDRAAFLNSMTKTDVQWEKKLATEQLLLNKRLLNAAERINVYEVSEAIMSGAFVNAIDDTDGNTALHKVVLSAQRCLEDNVKQEDACTITSRLLLRCARLLLNRENNSSYDIATTVGMVISRLGNLYAASEFDREGKLIGKDGFMKFRCWGGC